MNKKIILALLFTLLLVGCNSSTQPTSGTSIIVSDDYQSESVAKEVPVLMYHHLLKKEENTFTSNGVVLNVENFQQQMDYLYNNQYTTITLTELEQWLLGNIELPKKSVCLTFDDGYLSSYIYAYPILKKYDFKAAQFLITSYVNDNSVEFDPKIQQTLSWQDIIKTTDVFEYSNHTHNLHKLDNGKGYLITKPLDFVKKDLIKNMELTRSPYFAYPYGHYNDDILELLPETGIRMAFTINNGSVKKGDSLLELKRYGISPKTSIATFISIVNNKNPKKHKFFIF
jgi:peptidoglycan/xylan/chitin deacetylase (PgdA/CDA1 family)